MLILVFTWHVKSSTWHVEQAQDGMFSLDSAWHVHQAAWHVAGSDAQGGLSLEITWHVGEANVTR